MLLREMITFVVSFVDKFGHLRWFERCCTGSIGKLFNSEIGGGDQPGFIYQPCELVNDEYTCAEEGAVCKLVFIDFFTPFKFQSAVQCDPLQPDCETTNVADGATPRHRSQCVNSFEQSRWPLSPFAEEFDRNHTAVFRACVHPGGNAGTSPAPGPVRGCPYPKQEVQGYSNTGPGGRLEAWEWSTHA